MKLDKVISIYQSTGKFPPYVQVSEVHYDHGDKPVLGASRPLCEHEAEGLFALTAKAYDNKPQLLPEDVLLWHSDSLNKDVRCIFWVKAHISALCRRGLEDTLVPWPSLIFDVTGSHLRVYAVKGKKRPTGSTKLYAAPLWNIIDRQRGRVCIGNCKAPVSTNPTQLVKEWKDIWFTSEFTKEGNNYFGSKLDELWDSLKDKKTFPAKVLHDLNTTLEEIL